MNHVLESVPFTFKAGVSRGVYTRLLRASAALALASALTGCGILSGAGPYRVSIATDADPNDPGKYELIDLDATNIGPFMRPVAKRLTTDVSQLTVGNVYLIPGDVIALMISDSAQEGALFSPLSTGGTVFPKLRLDAAGKVSLPYVGELKVSGMTLPQVERAVRDRLKGKAVDPQVHAELVGDLSGSVLVAGGVKAPGRFSALQGPLTLLDAINQAGGPVLEPHLVNVVVRTGSKVDVYSYQDLLAGKNRPVQPRSTIISERG